MDAVPFLIQKRRRIEHQVDFNLLKEMRDSLQWCLGEAIMLAEANVPPDESLEYFGNEGDRLQMMLNFPVNQCLFYAMATGDIYSLIKAEDMCAPATVQRWILRRRRTGFGMALGGRAAKVFDVLGPK